MRKLQNLLRRPALAVVCTALAALAVSFVPALALRLGDASLLAQPHARTRQAGAISLTGDDLYLTRVLKKFTGRDALNGYQAASLWPSGMSSVEPSEMMDYVRQLADAGVLDAAWLAYLEDQVGMSTYVGEDSLGFVSYITYGRRDENIGYYLLGITVERQTQKVVGLWATAEPELGIEPPDMEAVLTAYTAYLELDVLGDWVVPVDTDYEYGGLYSPSAGLLLTCSDGLYTTIPNPEFNLGGTSLRQYFGLNSVSVEPQTVQAWQEYTRSFGQTEDAQQPEAPDVEQEALE